LTSTNAVANAIGAAISSTLDPQQVFAKYRSFRRWIDEVLDPAARAQGISSCEMCHKHLSELPVPRFDEAR
jgi:hypothetical protein